MGRTTMAIRRIALLLWALLMVPLSACGKGSWTLDKYDEKLQKTGSAKKQLALLSEMAETFDLCDSWSEDRNPQIRKDLPEDLLPDTAGAESAYALPDSFRGKRWIALLEDRGVLRMYGDMYVHLPAQLRASSLQEAEAVLYMQHVQVDQEKLPDGGLGKLVTRDHRFFAMDRESRKVYSICSVHIANISQRAVIDSNALWERVRHALPLDGKRTLLEDLAYYQSLEHPGEELASLYELAAAHPDAFTGKTEYPELTKDIYGDSQQSMVPFVPDFNTAQRLEEIPENFLDKKYICLEVSTDQKGNDSLSWRGDLYGRLPQGMRAATLEEAEGAVIVHRYLVKQGLGVTYYYSDGSSQSFKYVPAYSLYLLDRTDGTLIEPLWADWREGMAAAFGSAPQDGGAAPFDASTAYEAGDTLFFGACEQDGDPDTGSEPIAWIVLGQADGGLLLLSEYELDCMPYQAGEAPSVTWGTCALRTWLNETFWKAAFTDAERGRILTREAGDKIFLLSEEQVHAYLPARFARSSRATVAADADTPGVRKDKNGWWLSTEDGTLYAKYVDRDGFIEKTQMQTGQYVRPALWLGIG